MQCSRNDTSTRLGPMGAAGRCSRQFDRVWCRICFRSIELHIKPTTERIERRMLLDNGTERRSETRDVLHSACMRVERQYRESISDNLRRWNLIPLCRLQQIVKLLTRERFPETLHVKIVLVRHILLEISPRLKLELVLVETRIINLGAKRRHVKLRMGWEHRTAWSEPLVSCDDDGVKHRLTEQEIPHPLRYDNVHLLGQRLLLHVAFQHTYNLLHTILLY
mmetsp:Transcript_35080/g.79572  ORF Transcript_35080/g.79572 Transcript_35080/m.79572 type:complete len:222 (+) Transcript_35080:965-1630(+)